MKLARRINKDAGASAAGDEASGIFFGDAFQYAHSGRADRDDATTGGFGIVDETRGFLAEFVALFVHGVGIERIDFDGVEGAEADVVVDEANGHAARADFIEQRRGEMQSGSGRGDRRYRAGRR